MNSEIRMAPRSLLPKNGHENGVQHYKIEKLIYLLVSLVYSSDKQDFFEFF